MAPSLSEPQYVNPLLAGIHRPYKNASFFKASRPANADTIERKFYGLFVNDNNILPIIELSTQKRKEHVTEYFHPHFKLDGNSVRV